MSFLIVSFGLTSLGLMSFGVMSFGLLSVYPDQQLYGNLNTSSSVILYAVYTQFLSPAKVNLQS